jgi:hypothetical protein
MKKKYLNKLTYLGFVLFLFLASCEKEYGIKPDNTDETSITEVIEKIETVYKEGCMKTEGFNPDYIKVETEAPDLIRQKILEELEASYSKTQVTKNGGSTVGVFKSGSCGSYPVFEVYMDEEDSDAESAQTGWVGDSYVTTGKNVKLEFCLVNGAYFYRRSFDYAVLSLSASYNWGDAEGLLRYFDNEDNNNDNYAQLNNVDVSGTYGLNYFGGNTKLMFYYYRSISTASSYLPNLGITYGTLGRYGSSQGNIYCDDEDNNNINYALIYADALSGGVPVGNVSNIWTAGLNTRLYISKAITSPY